MSEKVIRRLVDGGSANCWREQREGFVKVNRLHDAYVAAEKNWWYHVMNEAIFEATSHPGAVRILQAWGLSVRRLHWDGYPEILKREHYAQSWDIPVFEGVRSVPNAAGRPIEADIVNLQQEAKRRKGQ